jgi:hypothetical protein
MEGLKKTCEALYRGVSYLSQRLDATNSAIEEAYSSIYKHAGQGHWPKLTASQLEKALDKCGLGEDFNVAKPTIYASKVNKNTVEVEFKKS